jgi:hypothetical protein
MKKLILTALLLATQLSLFAEPQEVFGRSFMLIRPASYNIEMDQQLWHNFVYHKEGPWYGAYQLIGFYQGTRPTAKAARYFLINGKNELLIAGDATDATFIRNRDIRAEWLNLPTTFHGTMSVCPSQQQMGFTLMYNQDFKTFTDVALLKDWSIGVELPVLLVENNLKFTQYDLSSTTTEVGVQPDLFAAFNQCDWKYAKLPTRKQELIRPEKIKFTAGRALMHREFFQLASSMYLSVPLAHHQDAEFLFSPVVGLDRHVGIGGAVNVQFLLNKYPERLAWSFFVNLDGSFFIRGEEFRTFDLKGKPWSRYMKYTRRNSAPGVTVPGVNVMTFKSVVRPYGVFDFSTGWRINVAPFEFELGYDLWGFAGEKVELHADVINPANRSCGGLNEFGIAGSGTIMFKGEPIAATASESTIDCLAADDETFVAINQNDLDFCSAAAGSVLNHKVHAAAGIEHMGDKMNGFGGFGCYFEFAQKNASLSTWGVWFKVGGSF